MTISDIVAVSITVQDSAPKAVAFDTPLIVAKAPYVGARLYGISPSGLADMVTDGFATYDRAYQLMSRMSGQSGGTAQAYVFSRTTQHTPSLDFTVDITKTAVGQVLTFGLKYKAASSTITVTVVTNTVDAILDLVQAAIAASTAGVAGLTVTPDNATATKLTITTNLTGTFAQFDLGGVDYWQLADAGTDGSLAAQLAAAKVLLGESVYGLLIDSYAHLEHDVAATFAEANNMLFLAQTVDNTVLTSATSDIATHFHTASYNRSAAAFTRNMTSDWAAALLGRQLGQAPGSSNWHMRQLAGATADVLTSTAFNLARGKLALMFTTDRGVSHTWDGWAASGRYFDITHGVDFLKADIETRVYQAMLNQEKIAFNGAGLGVIEGAIRGALGNAQNALGLIEPGWTVTMPDLVGYSTVDKAARLLRTVRFTAVLTGAVNKVTVAGTLTLS